MTLSSLNPALCNHYQDGVVSLNAPDRLDAEAAIVLKRQAVGSMVGRPVLVLLDVSRVSSIQASGVAGLLELLREVRSRGGDLRLHGSSSDLDVARLQAHLGHVARIYADPGSAIEGGSRPAAQRGIQRRETPARVPPLKLGRLKWMRTLLRP